MTLFFDKKPKIERPDYSEEERLQVIAALRQMFSDDADLRFKDIGSLVKIDGPAGEQRYYLGCRILKNPEDQLVAVSNIVLGSGTFGTVYLAQNIETHEWCVAKEQGFDISEEIELFNGISADQYKQQTFVARPKPNVEVWLGFMPFFNGVSCDQVNYACNVAERELRDLVLFTKSSKETDEKRLALIKAAQAANTKARLAQAKKHNTVILVPISDEQGNKQHKHPEGNHPILVKFNEFLVQMQHSDFTNFDDLLAYAFSEPNNTKQDKLEALDSLERRFARALEAKLEFDLPASPMISSASKISHVSSLLDNLQMALKVAVNFCDRVKTAHDQDYLFIDLKLENAIVNKSADIFMIDSAGVRKTAPGAKGIIEEDITPDGTVYYFTREQKEALKHNQIYYMANLLQALRKDPDLAGRTPITAEVEYAHSAPKRHLYSKKSDTYTLGLSLQMMICKIIGLDCDEEKMPDSIENPHHDPAIDLLNQALVVIARLKSDARVDDASVSVELETFKQLLAVVESLNHFDKSRDFIPNIMSKIWGDSETENEKIWRAAASILVAGFKHDHSEQELTYNYKRVAIPGVAEIKRNKNDVFVQLPVLKAEDLDNGAMVDPVFAMLDNLNPGSVIIIGHCARTPEIAVRLFEKAVAMGLKPEYDRDDGTSAAVQQHVKAEPK